MEVKVWKILLTFSLKSFIPVVHQEKGILKEVTLQGLVLSLEAVELWYVFKCIYVKCITCLRECGIFYVNTLYHQSSENPYGRNNAKIHF